MPSNELIQTKMMLEDTIICYHCNKEFYLNGFRYVNAKTIGCIYCGKRIIKSKSK